MSKIVFILRHDRTEPFSETGQDFARKLTADGFEAATKMGGRIAAGGFLAQSIYCSTAARTQQTLEAIWPAWQGNSPEVTHTDALYLASQGDLLSLINELPDEINKVMLVGHNPGLHQLVQSLSGAMLTKFSPGTFAVLESDIPKWEQLTPGSMTLSELLQPE